MRKYRRYVVITRVRLVKTNSNYFRFSPNFVYAPSENKVTAVCASDPRVFKRFPVRCSFKRDLYVRVCPSRIGKRKKTYPGNARCPYVLRVDELGPPFWPVVVPFESAIGHRRFITTNHSCRNLFRRHFRPCRYYPASFREQIAST